MQIFLIVMKKIMHPVYLIIVISDSEMHDIDHTAKLWSFEHNKDLYKSGIATKELHGTDFTLLQWLALNIFTFCKHPSMSKEAFSDFLRIQSLSRPENKDILPSGYYEARKMVAPYLLKKIVFHICPNGCVVYQKSEKYNFDEFTKCPVCDEDRFYNSSVRQPVPKKTFTYLPIGPRLARIYGEANLAQIVQSHLLNTAPNNSIYKTEMWDSHDSPVWNELYSNGGYFEGDKMGISFALELDGVNPYHNIGVMYSMTPIMLTMLNLPRHIRNAFGNIMLCGIIPGQNKSEACNLDPYLEILVDEMLYLCKCRAFSEYHKASVDVKLKLLLYVLDYPGLSKLFHIHGSGGLCGCHWCHVRGFHSAGLDKVIYLSNRSFLDKDDPLRLCVDKFYDKFEDRSSKLPARKAHEERDYRVAYKQSKNKAQANSVSTATGCKGPYPLSLLPGHNRIEESLPDACHTIKDFIQNIVYLITGKKKVNVKKVMEAEAASGREKLRVDLSATIVTGKRKRSEISTNQANEATGLQAYSHLCLLTDQEIVLGNERAAKLRVPSGFGLKPGNFLTNTRCLKSHDCKQIATQNILKYCLRGTLGIRERTTLFFLLDCLRDICAESDADDELDELEVKVNKALALFKRDFPVHLQNITTHFINHIVPDIKKYGPIYSTWMYVFERFNSWICKRALNMQYPEVSAIETYILFEWCNCMISSGKLPATAILTDHLGSYEEESLETKQETRESEKCNVKNSVIY